MKFIENKYLNWYNNIIYRAKNTQIDNSDYHEKHHIIPRCLGGSNSKNNIVLLTGREHFICHILLTKITEGREKHKMIHAAIGMKRKRQYQKRYINSRLYEAIKKEFAILTSLRNKNRKISSETRVKMSLAKKGLAKTEEHKLKISLANKGKIRSIEHCEALSVANKGKTHGPISEITREKHRAHRHSLEARAKISESNRRRKYSEETRKKISEKIKQLHKNGKYKNNVN